MKRKIYLLLAGVVVLSVICVLFSNNLNSKVKNTASAAKTSGVADTTITTNTTNTKSYIAFNVEMDPEYHTTNPNELYKMADLVFTGKYIKDNKAFLTHDIITTDATFHVNKVLKGNISKQELNDGLNIQYYGGEMSLGDYLDQLDKHDA
jgi:hypothetical protein